MNLTQNTQFDSNQAYNAYQYVIRSIKHDYGYSWGIFQGKRLIKRYDDKDLIAQDLRAHGLPIRSFFISQTIETTRADYNILLLDRCLESLIHADKIAEIAKKLQSLGLAISINDNCLDVYKDGVKVGFVDVSNKLTYGNDRYGFERNIHTTKSIKSVITYFSNVISR